MTPNGREALRILVDLEEKNPGRIEGFTAAEITAQWTDLPDRGKPVMTVSSYLTHIKRPGYVTRTASSDKTIAWWKSTKKGREYLAAQG
jgi:hypothetical protein